MPRFCASCGTQMDDSVTFCANCGKAVGQPSGAAAAAPAPAAQPAPAAASGSGLSDNIAGLLCYSPVGLIASIIFLVAEPYNKNKFIRFHAFQALFSCGACVALGIVFVIVNIIAGLIFAPLVIALGLIEMLVWLGLLIVFVYMMIAAYQMKMTKLPIIGALAEKQANA